MRTTINLEASVKLPAEPIAVANRGPLGNVISEFVIEALVARRERRVRAPVSTVIALRVLAHPYDAPAFGLENGERAIGEA